jgi:hypothetical protein
LVRPDSHGRSDVALRRLKVESALRQIAIKQPLIARRLLATVLMPRRSAPR